MQVLSSLGQRDGHGFKDLDEVIDLQMQAGSSERLSSLSCPGTPACLTTPCGCWWPRECLPCSREGGRAQGHGCCCPGESKAGAVCLLLIPSLCVSWLGWCLEEHLWRRTEHEKILDPLSKDSHGDVGLSVSAAQQRF